MEENKPIRFYNKLSFRIYFYYAIILCFFAVLLGVIFINLYSQNYTENYKDEMEEKVSRIARRMETFIKEENNLDVSSFLATLDDIETRDIWIVSNPSTITPMGSHMENISIQDIPMTPSLEKVLEKLFRGEAAHHTGFEKIYDKTMIVVGVPILKDQEVVGAVIMNSFQESQDKIIERSKLYIIISALVALFVSFIIAVLVARKLSSPILKMRSTAIKLANGEYEESTGIDQNDEIGDLAKTIDILSGRLLENEVERKNLEQMRLDFFANVSHELRTPITVIRAYTETLVDGVVTDADKIGQYYDRMLLECKSMERLVGDLLVLSKMQNPDFTIDAEPINLKQIFDDILRSIHAISAGKGIQFKISMDNECYMMMGDYDRLRQMFMVILDNAVKFSEEKSSIYITITEAERFYISIRDEGIGISGEELPNIFEKFYKSKLRQNAKGSGLGLAIAKQIALKHGGNITVNSKLGMGTEFIFSFQPIEC